MADIARMLQELLDEETDNCNRESDSDLSDENINYDKKSMYKNIKYFINKSKMFPSNICIKNYLFILRCNKIYFKNILL